MPNRKTLSAAFILVSLLLIAVPVFAAYNTGDIVADDEKIMLYDGEKEVALKEVLKSNKVSVISFMQTSCAACQSEMNHLIKLMEKSKNTSYYAVSVDMQGKVAVDRYLEQFPKYKVFTFILDPKFKLAQQFRFSFTPALLIMDNKGEVLFKIGGFDMDTPAAIEKYIK